MRKSLDRICGGAFCPDARVRAVDEILHRHLWMFGFALAPIPPETYQTYAKHQRGNKPEPVGNAWKYLDEYERYRNCWDEDN